jgi:hypothetical protein
MANYYPEPQNGKQNGFLEQVRSSSLKEEKIRESERLKFG